MNTKLVMTASALSLAMGGILLTFLPAEFLTSLGLEAGLVQQLFVQLMGALYFGFGMLNWMSKGGLIGGIYKRPVAVANFAHFLIGSLALAKGLLATPQAPALVWAAASFYTLFAITFGVFLFRHPISDNKSAVAH
jgi:hypothetical protein